ncbi:PAS domain S-box protein [Hydrogenovibrio sp. JE_KL2]|uniref:PAS domain S-box protein n=1 Tax=Hydrogenovibrio sp. JE_KL2 TaxID=2651188 RepID=UPI00128B178C|nr:PAS domain S-box protein [Hydrogenovibrio sp. JE_KL2]MPQ76364.1 PAS domain S-box protein [Hydrogenovibrio sp. JE_KL2]
MSFSHVLDDLELKDHIQLLDSLPVGMGIVETNGTIRFINKAFAEMLGRSAKEMVGMHQSSLHPENGESKNTFAQHIEALVKGEIISLEAEVLRADGEIIPVEITANTVLWRGESLVVGIFKQITKRKEALALLQASQREMNAIFETSQVGIMLVDADRMIVRCNQRMCDLFGAKSLDELVGQPVRTIHVSEETYVEFGQRYFFSLVKNRAMHIEYQFKRLDGSIFWGRISGKAMDDHVPADLSKGVIWVLDDISEMKAVEHDLTVERNLFAGGPTVILKWAPYEGWPIIYVSKNVETILGYTSEEMMSPKCSFEKLIHPHDFPGAKKILEDSLFGQYKHFELSYRLKTKSGEYRNFYDYNQAEYHPNGEVKELYGYLVDMTEYFEVQKMSDLLLKSTTEGIFGIDLQGRTTFVNPAALQMLGYEESELLGHQNHSLIHHSDAAGHEIPMKDCQMSLPIKTRSDYHVTDEVLWRKDGTYFPIEYWSTPIRQDGQVVGSVVTFKDISEIVAQKQKISDLAYFDNLTGLPNRQMFFDALKEELIRERDSSHRAVMLLLDLDHFKEINDSLGHPIGDKLLLAVISRIRRKLHEKDVFARMGGDEFGILLSHNTGGIEAECVADSIVALFNDTFDIEGHEVKTSVSVGIVFCDPSKTRNEMISEADTALYHAKSSGRSCAVFFEPSMLDKVHRDVTLFGALSHAIEHQEFELYYQLQYDPNTKQPAGAEALIRWPKAPEAVRDFNSPADFIPIAERRNLIQALCLWEIEQVAKDLPLLRAVGYEHRISINLSGKQLASSEDMGQLLKAIQDSDLAFTDLEFEITETAFAELSEEVQKLLDVFIRNGAELAIDDFGTGFSSLAVLRQLKSTYLKIDKQFIDHVHSNADDYAIVAATISMSKALGKKVVAEGVESEIQLQLLKELNCDLIQGYYFAKPQPLQAVCEQLKNT